MRESFSTETFKEVYLQTQTKRFNTSLIRINLKTDYSNEIYHKSVNSKNQLGHSQHVKQTTHLLFCQFT